MAKPKKTSTKLRKASRTRLGTGRRRVKDAWHFAFDSALLRFGSPAFDKLFELLLMVGALRPDVVLLRRNRRSLGRAKILRRLWGMLSKVTLLEYKSPVEGSFAPGDLLRLVAYGAVYHLLALQEIAAPSDLTLVLVLPEVTRVLRDEIASMGWTLTPLGGGYAKVTGGQYAILVASIDEVCESEKEEILAVFSRTRPVTGAGAEFLREWSSEANVKQRKAKDMPGYDEVMRKFLKEVPVELALSVYKPEQILAGLPPEMLGALSPEYVRSLPVEVQRDIKKRLRRAGQAAASHRV